MIWDDHDTHDDWNISESWCEEMEAQPWWEERIEGALVSYWIYQHLGNLSPAEIERRGLLEEVLAKGDAGPLLRKEAGVADWRNRRRRQHVELRARPGRVRLVVFDSREGRVFDPPCAR